MAIHYDEELNRFREGGRFVSRERAMHSSVARSELADFEERIGQEFAAAMEQAIEARAELADIQHEREEAHEQVDRAFDERVSDAGFEPEEAAEEEDLEDLAPATYRGEEIPPEGIELPPHADFPSDYGEDIDVDDYWSDYDDLRDEDDEDSP